MDDKDKKIEELEQQLDSLLTEKYLNSQQDRYHELIRNELEILVRTLYKDCKAFIKEDKEIEAPKEMLKSLVDVIEQFSRDYNWPLSE